jgi:hypothetical protein
MCEANETLNRARYALEVMMGNQVLDLGRLRQILETQCDHHGGTE